MHQELLRKKSNKVQEDEDLIKDLKKDDDLLEGLKEDGDLIKGLKEDDPRLIGIIKNWFLEPVPHPDVPYKFESTDPEVKGQIGVPPVVDGLLKQKCNGFFIGKFGISEV